MAYQGRIASGDQRWQLQLKTNEALTLKPGETLFLPPALAKKPSAPDDPHHADGRVELIDADGNTYVIFQAPGSEIVVAASADVGAAYLVAAADTPPGPPADAGAPPPADSDFDWRIPAWIAGGVGAALLIADSDNGGGGNPPTPAAPVIGSNGGGETANLTVSENTTAVTTVTATDADSNTLTYSITGGQDAARFVIDATTGALRFATAPDFENPTDTGANNTYEVIVQASDGTRTDTQTLTITVGDVNETPVNRAPVLADANRSVDENSANGTVVGAAVTGTDADGDTLHYSITAGNGSGAFAIDGATGVISVADGSKLNFETAPNFSLTVRASDAGGLFDDATVSISLKDVNEAPVITDLSLILDENSANGTAAGSVVASDPDTSAPNNVLTYAITGGNGSGAFAIDGKTGAISVADGSKLDFETTESFGLTVRATDGGGLFDEASVNINLTDLNEAPGNNPPVYDDAVRSIAENSASGTPVGAPVTATDVDGDTLIYAIIGGNGSGAFAINALTGQISVADSSKLDFEQTPNFTLTLRASDGNISNTAVVQINVSDVNEAPVVNDQSFSIDENSSNGTVIGSVIASDPDTTAPRNTLSYSITGGNGSGAFAIDSKTGAISVADGSKIDFEATPSFSLTVKTTDGLGLSDSAIVTISVNDHNEAPTVADQQGFTIDENSANDSTVGVVLATDPDTTAPNNTLSYSLVGGSGAFAINSLTGAIRVADGSQLDFETTPSFGLTVRATDGGGLFDDSIVTIGLNDKNETPNVDDQSFSLDENSANSAAVGTVFATDPDTTAPNNTLSYAITAGNGSGAFAINGTTGAITVADGSKLDFETTPSFSLTVKTTDGGGLSDDAVITISIGDLNEAPSIDDQNFSIDENSANGTAVGTVAASDPDTTAPNNTLSYSITAGNGSGAFAIDSATGAITVADVSKLDYETTPTFALTVRATDGGTLFDEATVTVDLNNLFDEVSLADLGSGGLVINGASFPDFSGSSVASAGDVNGDGFDDVIIGSPGAYTSTSAYAGFSYLVFGGTGLTSPIELATLGSGGVTFRGIADGDSSGSSVASAGDFNGDGYADLIIGANRADANGRGNAGQTYVIYGGPALASDIDLGALGSGGFTLQGIAAGDYSGISVASAGDVNGDGFDDLIVGAIQADPDGRTGAGETYIVFGGMGVTGSVDLGQLGSRGFAIWGIDDHDYSSGSVASAGDVNGDGFDDLFIGAFGADPDGNEREGESYVVFGSAHIGAGGSIDLGTLGSQGFTIKGVGDHDYSGYSVASAGDINGDGYQDLIIGAHFTDQGGKTRAGESYVVYGGPALSGTIDLGALGSGGFTLKGIDQEDFSGRSVASAGDINGDGFDDLIVGAPYANPNGKNNAGESYVIFGGSGLTGTIDLNAIGAHGFTIKGALEGDYSGHSVASAGDVDGDGFDDLIIGATGAEPNNVAAGQSYILFGGDFLNQIGAAQLGDNNANNLVGTTADETLIGGGGKDTLDGLSGNDVLIGGEGDDTLIYDAADVSRVDGGNGRDTLFFDTGGHTLNLSALNNFGDPGNPPANPYTNIEIIDLAGEGNDLLLSPADLFRITGAATGDDLARDNNLLRVDGDADDSVASTTGVWLNLGIANADGDLMVGGDYTLYQSGEARLLVDNDIDQTGIALFQPLINLGDLGARGFTLTGLANGDYSGQSVASAGDINGDGYDDLIVGAPSRTPPAAGESFVVFGGTGMTGTYPLNAALHGGVRFTGVANGDGTGFSVASAGDVNGDGYDDLIIGAPYADPNKNSASGTSYVVFGGSGLSGTVNLGSLGTDGFVLDGIAGTDRSGHSVASAGDVNGDGFDDLIIGAYRASPNMIGDAGQSYVVFGGTGLAGTKIDLGTLGNQGITLNGLAVNDYSGFSVSSAGDVNGDGYDDLIVGAYGADPSGNSKAGESYVVFGGPGINDVFPLNSSSLDGFTISGKSVSDSSGFSVSAAGDINGDGFADVVVGANHAAPFGRFNAGTSYVVFGGAGLSGSKIDLGALGTGGFTISGAAPGDLSGYSVASAGDVNGDGYDDLVIGAFLADNVSKIDTGVSYLVFGGAGLAGTAIDLATLGSSGIVLIGNDPNDLTGRSVASAGDVDGDGFDDLIIGASRADPGGITNAGETYVVYGGDFLNQIGAAQLGDNNANNLVGTGAGESLNGGGGKDTLDGKGGNDVLIGGEGDDVLVYDAADTLRVDGGNGRDTLAITGSGVTLDLSVLNSFAVQGVAPESPYTNIEIIDLGGGGDNQLTLLDPADLFHLTGSATGDDGLRDNNLLRVDGNAGDRVTIGAGLWTLAGAANGDGVLTGGGAYSLYQSGEARLLVDKDVGVRQFQSVIDLSTAGSIIFGAKSGDASGYSISSAGDVNGDGFDDLLIGAARAAGVLTSTFNAGQSYVVFGGDSLSPTIDLANLGTQGFTIYGADAYDLSGNSVSSAGDIDGDGFDDLLIGALLGDGPANARGTAGESYVIYGGNGLPSTIDLASLGALGTVIHGVDGDDYSGVSVSSAGDVNGDGFDDYLIGSDRADGPANTDSRAGETYLVFGGVDRPASIAPSTLGAGGVVIYGADGYDRSGGSVSSAGDIDGDGYDDLLIGAARGNGPGESRFSAGESYVIFGDASLPVTIDLASLGTLGTVIYGADSNDFSGFSVSSAGDVNGDGFDDLLVGAFRADGASELPSDSGESYVIFGGPVRLATVDLGNLGTAGITVFGAQPGDTAGVSVSSAGDINGDGFDDLLIGASRAASGPLDSRYQAGESYVVFGGTDLPQTINLAQLSTAGFVIYGVDQNDSSGLAVSSAGDVNGDGFDDLLVGALSGDGPANGRTDAGETYLVYGGDFLSQIGAAQLGDSGDNIIVGTAGDESLVGGGGNDRLDGLAGNDVLIGGEGDDVLVYDDADTLRIDGGNGFDTLELQNTDGIDFTTLPSRPITNIERIDAENGNSGNVITLNLRGLLDLSSSGNDLFVIGDAGDTVVLNGSLSAGGTFNDGSYTYDIYTAAGTDAKLYVEQEISVA